MAGALSGYRVVDLTSVLFGAGTSPILGDLGGEVIEFEAPGTRPDSHGDALRYAVETARSAAIGPVFTQFNRTKRSVLLDLKTEARRAQLGNPTALAEGQAPLRGEETARRGR